ncbi:MAG: hypothetical protein HPY90_15295 [Syntrophothermus sp.]|uniref:hypothetical protein n=1 Tax=Syntrophothermus sp. TaxID=2736299 RepID=UPI00257ED9C0|nr:hypothetical protein [Syntrophothermus sp.]NSW84564.1 hypothetical protein [Syntrophothermus sp.]
MTIRFPQLEAGSRARQARVNHPPFPPSGWEEVFYNTPVVRRVRGRRLAAYGQCFL